MPEPPPSSLIIQPSPYAGHLVETLMPYANVKTVLPRRRIYLTISDVNYCYLIVQGRVSIHRQSDDRMLAIISSPAIFGLARQVMQNMDIYLVTSITTQVGKMTLTEAEKRIAELGLWESVSKYMMVITSKLYAHFQQVDVPSAYDVVCLQLKELMSEASSLRANVTAQQYIRDKTGLSRSRVMKVLSDLKKGGYIEIERGVLLSISHLPDKY